RRRWPPRCSSGRREFGADRDRVHFVHPGGVSDGAAHRRRGNIPIAVAACYRAWTLTRRKAASVAVPTKNPGRPDSMKYVSFFSRTNWPFTKIEKVFPFTSARALNQSSLGSGIVPFSCVSYASVHQGTMP